MIHQLNALLAPAVMERLVLLINHVLAAEPQALARLQPHAGRRLQLDLQNWPRLLPAPPVLAFGITPAGLLEWQPEAGATEGEPAALHVRLDASNPAALALGALAGEAPDFTIEGDGQLASDVDWLLKNLRWDLAADLERLFGPAAAHELQRLGHWLASGLRAALSGAGALAGRWRAR